MTEKTKYKRVCLVCHRVTYDWFCCGKRTRRLNMQVTLGDKVKEAQPSREKAQP